MVDACRLTEMPVGANCVRPQICSKPHNGRTQFAPTGNKHKIYGLTIFKFKKHFRAGTPSPHPCGISLSADSDKGFAP